MAKKKKKYSVPFTITVSGTMTVQAVDEHDAIDICQSEASFEGYVGNGGSDKFIGTSDERISLNGDFIEIDDINLNDITEEKE